MKANINSKVGLFIPCYIDQFYPQVGVATLELLIKLGLDVGYPLKQTCCGQPLANGGSENDAIPIHLNFVNNFSDFDYVVSLPEVVYIMSGSITTFWNKLMK